MAEMTENKVIEIIGTFIGEHEIKLIDFPSVTSVDEFSSVLLVQPTGAGNRIQYGVFKNQVVAEIKEPADNVINEVKEAGKDAALVVEAATKAVGDANTAAISADEAARVAEQAAENVKDGKTPVFGTVTAKDGDKAAATYTLNGVDANGNPVIDVDFTLEKGADGKHPILQSGNITTLAPNEQVKASFRANGYNTESRPIYLVDLAIPKGDKGQAGDGSGNVLINPAGLKKDARYLFVPKADGSAEGAFVEYEKETSRNLIVSDGIYENHKMSYLENQLIKKSFTGNASEYIYASSRTGVAFPKGKYLISFYHTISEMSDGSLNTSNVRLSKRAVNTTGSFATVEYLKGNEKSIVEYKFMLEEDSDILLQIYSHNFGNAYAKDVFIKDLSIRRIGDVVDWSLSPEDQKAEIEKQITSKGYQTASDVKSSIDAKVSYLTGSNSVTTLSSIPATKRIILATLGAATDITLKEPLEVGKELLISINPTADFDQPLPVSGDWQSLDGDTLSLKANKPAELSVLCVGDNKYILSSKVAE